MSVYQTAVAYFPSQASAEAAITALKAAGFNPSQIGSGRRHFNSREYQQQWRCLHGWA